MSLYWQQAVPSRKSAQPPVQHHVATPGSNQAETWQNVNLGNQQVAPQMNYWSQEPVNEMPQNYQQNYSQQPAPAQNYQAYQHHQESYCPPVQHTPILSHNTPQYVPQDAYYAGYQNYYPEAVAPQLYQRYQQQVYAEQHQGHLPQVSSLSSIPEFETIDFPVTTTAPSSEPEQPHLVQEHPVVALPSEQPEHSKQSSQVTPESTYSVDTFNSNHSKEEKKAEDEWDDWEQTPAAVHEKSPFAVESTQSEPVPSIQSEHSRESTVSLEQQVNNEAERQPVAQVAPLVKNLAESDHPVARVGPVYQAPIETNIHRVAPTRPIQASAPIPEPVPLPSHAEIPPNTQSTNAHVPVNPTPAEEVHPVPTAAPVAHDVSRTQDDHSRLAVPEQEERRTTPDALQIENIGHAQATSTPNETVEGGERPPVERRTSVSSVSSLRQPLAVAQTAQNGEHSDSTQGSAAFGRGGVRGSYQERYKDVREKYMESRSNASQVMRRLDQTRIDTPKLVRGNPLTEISGRRSAIHISSRNRADTSNSSYNAGNMSAYSQPDPALNESIDISNNGPGYGEEFVDASRRSRLNRSRPPSRAKSDIGDDVPYHRPYPPANGRHFDSRGYPVHPQYYAYQQQAMSRHSGRQSVGGMPQYPNDYYQQQAMMYQRSRPHSTYDSKSHERFQRSGGNMMTYDAYAARPEDEEDESFSGESDVEDEEGESADEMRNYNMSAVPRGVNNSFSSFSMASHARQPLLGRNEIYYLGSISVNLKDAEAVLRKFPVPREFALLEPMEKVGYVYFTVLHHKLPPQGVQAFQNTFKREYYNYICNKDTPDSAFKRICQSILDDYKARHLVSQQKAYEASQKQLFSDDRESADGLSDRASVYDRDDDRASDILSIDQRAPLKYRSPHAFLKFGPGGKKITVLPDHSVSVVYIDDVKTLLHDNHSSRLTEIAQNFKGPLLHDRTPSHSVLLYIQNQMMRIGTSDLAKSNPRSCDVVDCLLLWKLLETVVKQHGRVTGPDIANLLVDVGASTSKKTLSNHREKSATPSQESIRSTNPDPKAYEIFTGYLLRGHIDEAVNYAVNQSLHTDAMILVRRIFAGNEKKLADIEARFLATRPSSNPVMTLVAVASGEPAPVLTNPPIDDAGTWRSHAAIVLANLKTPHAIETVYRLGRVLAKREYHAAADFCFLAVALLSNFQGVNVFEKPTTTEDELDSQQYVSLIHASLPDDEWDSTACRFGFSLMDLHATEIFDYAIKMSAPADFVSPLNNSVEFQRKRLQYAQLLAGFGSFNAEAFRYLLSVACSMWYSLGLFSLAELTTLADLADSLRMYAAEDASDTTWIDNIRGTIVNRQQGQHAVETSAAQQAVVHQEPVVSQDVPVAATSQDHLQHTNQQQFHAASEPESNPISSRSRTDSLVVEARDWHADRQEPIQMSPRGSTTSSSFRRDSVAHDVVSPPLIDYQTPPPAVDYQTSRGRVDSISSQRGQSSSYGEQLCQTQQQLYGQQSYNHHNDYDSATTESAENSHESTPVRRPQATRSSISNESHNWQPSPEPPRPQPPVQHHHHHQQHQSVPNAAASQPVAATSQPRGAAQVPQENGLKKTGSKSSGWMGSLMSKVRGAVPGHDEMKLPDDKNKTIYWDDEKKKWVGDGVEEETAAPPPPVAAMAPSAIPPSASTTGVAGGLRAARAGGSSRYLNPMGGSGSGGAAPLQPAAPIAPPTMPHQFSFIPQMPDDADSVDPFSGASNPTVHGADQAEHPAN